ncbi:MAG TPA: M28 family peptidase [Gemmatimonadota bacterium]|nr:M28 family peptidase [Gemmatimonadota bacterium]
MKRLKLTALAVTLAAAGVAAPVAAQDYAPLLDAGRRDLLHEALSGEMAKEHVIAITRHHRVQGSRGYRDAANYVLEQLRTYGYGEAEAWIESFPSDGKIHYQTWQAPSGWDIERAELRMVEPYADRIVGYPEVAMSLITYSNPGEVTAELVWVGSGTRDSDYEGKDVRGKIVLATGYGGSVHRLAVIKYGAAAVVCYLDDGRAQDHPDMLAYTGMWPLPDELEHVTFGFNITNRQGERLRGLLESGQRVVMSGSVKGAGLESYFMDVPVARIEGSERPDEELVIVAHLDHPKESANDNASGSAATLDIALTLRRLIDEGRMERPKRTLRFLWVPEWHGTMAYIDRYPEMAGPTLGGSYLASINLDMVGENLELLHSRMYITHNPASVPSVLDAVVENMAQMVDGMNVRTPRGSLSEFNYRIAPYSGGSDHMMFIDRKIPSMMIGHSDYTHHTSEDTPDKVDPVELERSEIIAAASLLYLSDLSEEEALDLVYLSGADASRRLGAAARRARRGMHASELGAYQAFFEARNVVNHAAAWEQQAVSSILQFNDSDRVRGAVEAVNGRLQQQHVALVAALRGELELPSGGVAPAERTEPEDRRVPVRLTRGPLDFGLPASRLSPEDAAWYSTREFTLGGNARFELVNFVDGERTVTQIRDALAAEYGPVSIAVVAHYLDDLAKVGVVEWE